MYLKISQDRTSDFVKLQKDWLAELIKLENELS